MFRGFTETFTKCLVCQTQSEYFISKAPGVYSYIIGDSLNKPSTPQTEQYATKPTSFVHKQLPFSVTLKTGLFQFGSDLF